MQIANGLVIRDGGHTQPVYNVTPAEAVVLHKLHFAGAKGNPLKNFVVLEGAATTQVGSKREKTKRNNLEGDPVEVEINVPILRERTNAEELTRLRRAYFGTVKGSDGKSAPVVNVCFPGPLANLPMTFAELEGQLEGVGAGFFGQAPQAAPAAGGDKEPEAGTDDEATAAKRAELLQHTREELVALAEGLQIEVGKKEKPGAIVEKILKASKEAVQQ